MEQLGREEQGRTLVHGLSLTAHAWMKKEAVLKPARPIYSTNRSSSNSTGQANSIELRSQWSTKSSNMLALEMEFIGVGWVSLSNDPTASKA
ncbi:unnamed protein product [Microthlaspi erraticum]|uniref:Uncharacterized protein n=1 Tax=Microthlaspi erraticum TaxID=1685480 RepID=A0A6D2JC08_9BRAS|nr:unnamed protein product [Microthlaspi erraticum]